MKTQSKGILNRYPTCGTGFDKFRSYTRTSGAFFRTLLTSCVYHAIWMKPELMHFSEQVNRYKIEPKVPCL